MNDSNEHNASIIKDIFALNGIDADEMLTERFAILSEKLLETNRQMNLTAVDTAEGVALLHFADSMTLLPHLPDSGRLLDVGCGAGFPAIPIAIARSSVKVTALDSTGKKLGFVRTVSDSLGLDNISTLCGRAEEFALNPAYRAGFDIVTARAVARLNILCELCMPFIRVGGRFLAMKSRAADDEIAEARHCIAELGGEIADNIALTLNGGGEPLSRSIIIIQKTAPTPKIYPRRYAQITKNPL